MNGFTQTLVARLRQLLSQVVNNANNLSLSGAKDAKDAKEAVMGRPTSEDVLSFFAADSAAASADFVELLGLAQKSGVELLSQPPAVGESVEARAEVAAAVADLFAAFSQAPQCNELADLLFLESVHFEKVAKTLKAQSAPSAPAFKYAEESHKKWLESPAFLDLYSSSLEVGQQEPVPAADALLADMTHAMSYDDNINQISASLFNQQQPPLEPSEITSVVQSTYDSTLLGVTPNVFSPDPQLLDQMKQMESIVSFAPDSTSTADALSDYLFTQKSQVYNSARINPFRPIRATSVSRKSTLATSAAPIKLQITESNSIAKSLYEAMDHQEILGMEVEYFFDEVDRLEKAKANKTFLGAGTKILGGLVKAITGAPIAKGQIYETAAGQTSTSTASKSSLESISDAIVDSTRESQWSSASSGKPKHTPKESKSAKKGKRVGELDARLAGKTLDEIYKKDGANGVNPVDVAVDDVLREGKLRAKL
ncbi:hypothetical protein HDU79_010992 [Rhizoclosmatium sp. JEL0117]|nr:hypothetical protein HDU79_010992 [Rhizoclosmatium sp. JEL0117]